MPNYMTIIDEEIERLRQRLVDLEATKRVLVTLQGQTASPAGDKLKKTPHTKSNHGALKRARKAALSWLQLQTEPRPSRDILAALATHKLSDSTIWKGLKEMRDEGLIKWDEDTRYYSVVRMENPDSGTIADQFKPGGLYAEKKVVKS